MLKTSHKSNTQRAGLQEIEIKKGQFIFGRKKAAIELDMSESYVYKILKQFERENLITLNSNNKFTVLTIVNWDMYQSIEGEEEQQSNSGVTTKEQQSNNKVTHTRIIKNDKNDKKDTIGKKIIPPTWEEVENYCAERGNGIDAEYFIDFYESKGWMIGKSKMVDWKSTVRTWEKNRNDNKRTKGSGDVFREMMEWGNSNDVSDKQEKGKEGHENSCKPNKFNNFSQRDYDFDALEQKLLLAEKRGADMGGMGEPPGK